MRKTWTDAVWEAVQRQARLGPAVTREQLIVQELENIRAAVGSKGATPEQTLSRVLQELRDKGVLIFDGGGRYRVAAGLAGLAVDAAAAATEALRMQVCRVGQGSFRRQLDERWQGKCPLTGIADRELLRAAHVVPWNRCESDAERRSVDNGLLLSALWDAAFDRGLVAFDDDGVALFAARMGGKTERALRHADQLALAIPNAQLQARLGRHRALHKGMGFRRAA